MMMRIALLTLALGFATPPAAFAQRGAPPSVPQSLSLQDAIDLAHRYNPTLRQQQNNRAGAAWGVRNSYAAFLPQLSANGTLGFQGAGTQNFVTTSFVSRSSTLGSSYSLNLSLLLSGRTLLQPGVANAQYEAVEAGIAGAAVNLESTIRGQYLAVKEAEAQVELAQLQLTRNREFLRLAQARFDVGQNTLLDVRRAEVEQGQSEIAVLRADNQVTIEKLRLFQTIGIPATDDPAVVTLTDTFPVVEPHWDLGPLLSEANADNPDLVALRAQHSSARASERQSKSTWLPTLSLSAGWSGFTQQFTNSNFLVVQAEARADATFAQCQFTEQNLLNPGASLPLPCSSFAWDPASADGIRAANDVFPFDFTAQPFSARMTISLPLFTQFSRPLEIAEASARADDAAESVRARELLVRTEVSQGYYSLIAAYEAITIQENNRVAAREQLRLATERYRVGSGTFFELLDAQLAEQQSEADYVNAIYAYHRSIATLEAAVGRPLR